MEDQYRLMTVHAHPDDEASKGPGTIARYRDEGIRSVLVCCTGGEEGDILNPALDTPEVRGRLPAKRLEDLEKAASIIGYDEVVLLGYRDSGMPDSEANANPACFAQAPLEEAVGRLVGHIRRVRPQVLVIYGDEQSGYPHPDHLRVHEVGLAAYDAAPDPAAYPETGAPWEVAKLYYTVFSAKRFKAMHEKFVELGLESPFDEKWRARWERVPDEPVTTAVDVRSYSGVRRDALLAHETQVDPTSPFWFGLPEEVQDTLYPFDEYRLARTAGGLVVPDSGTLETDLFAGIRS